VRVYVPASQALLADLVGSGRLSGPVPGCAVTDALRDWLDHAAGDDEEPLEFAAQSRAADLSLALITGDQTPRRAVLAVDGDARLDPAVDDLVGVVIESGFELRDVRALFVDEDQAEGAVRAALSALAALPDEDDSVPAAVEELDAHDLVWFAPEEIAGWLDPGGDAGP
jgi:hypothetical protein